MTPPPPSFLLHLKIQSSWKHKKLKILSFVWTIKLNIIRREGGLKGHLLFVNCVVVSRHPNMELLQNCQWLTILPNYQKLKFCLITWLSMTMIDYFATRYNVTLQSSVPKVYPWIRSYFISIHQISHDYLQYSYFFV